MTDKELDRAALKAMEATNYCTKHKLYHGQKYKSCTPIRRKMINIAQPDDLRKDYTDKLSKEMSEVSDHQIDPINHPQPDNTIKDLVEAAYLHGVCVENLDTGELEPPRDISEVQWIVDKLQHKIAQEANKAVIAKLEELKENPSCFKDTSPFAGELVEYISIEEIDEEIAELTEKGKA